MRPRRATAIATHWRGQHQCRSIRKRQDMLDGNSVVGLNPGLGSFVPNDPADDNLIAVPELDGAAVGDWPLGMDERAAGRHVEDARVTPTRGGPHPSWKQDSPAKLA